jgi:hypothetical protein
MTFKYRVLVPSAPADAARMAAEHKKFSAERWRRA